MAKLIFLFTVVPLVELWILLSVGQLIGFWPTVWIALGTAVLGATLAKREGRRVLEGWRQALGQGRIPDEGITSGILVLVGATLLVTPGFMTDVLGLLMLFPPTRRQIAAVVRARLEARMAGGGLGGAASAEGEGGGASWNVRVVSLRGSFGEDPDPGGGEERAWPGSSRGEVLDVEAESVVEEDAKDPARLPR